VFVTKNIYRLKKKYIYIIYIYIYKNNKKGGHPRSYTSKISKP